MPTAEIVAELYDTTSGSMDLLTRLGRDQNSFPSCYFHQLGASAVFLTPEGWCEDYEGEETRRVSQVVALCDQHILGNTDQIHDHSFALAFSDGSSWVEHQSGGRPIFIKREDIISVRGKAVIDAVLRGEISQAQAREQMYGSGPMRRIGDWAHDKRRHWKATTY